MNPGDLGAASLKHAELMVPWVESTTSEEACPNPCNKEHACPWSAQRKTATTGSSILTFPLLWVLTPADPPGAPTSHCKPNFPCLNLGFLGQLQNAQAHVEKETGVCSSAHPLLSQLYRLWPGCPRASGRHKVDPWTNVDNAVCLRLVAFSFTYNAHISLFFSSFLSQMALSNPRPTEADEIMSTPPATRAWHARWAPCGLAAPCWSELEIVL